MNERDLVFHGLAIKRHSPPRAIAELMDLSESATAAVLENAAATGRAAKVKDAFTLTPLARVALEARYGLHFAGLREDKAFRDAYDAFERINRSLKAVITDWQTVAVGGTKVANDHSDPAHDEGVIHRLGTVHDQVEPLLQKLASKLPRMSVYLAKLERALDAAEEGDHEWVSDIRRDSYHTVWFELHEDLLRIMGRAREE